jgi:ABC-2 type transport system ATP-binding protein
LPTAPSRLIPRSEDEAAFARSLINAAPLLVLDEPTNTLDVPSARELRAIVRDLNRQGHAVLYTTHQMVEAEELCQRVAIIDRGQVLALGTVSELKSSLQQEGVIRVEGVIPPNAYEAVKRLEHVREAALTSAADRAELRVVTRQPRLLLPELIRALFDNGAVIEDISPAQVTLEDMFVALTGRTLAEDTRRLEALPGGGLHALQSEQKVWRGNHLILQDQTFSARRSVRQTRQ